MWALVLLVAITAACPETSLGRDFSECQNETRTAFFYWKEECADALPLPVKGLNCNLPCEPGSVLGFDRASNSSTCEQCPAGTYSVGGGWRVAGSEEGWKRLNESFSTYCYTSDYLRWDVGANCEPWTADPSGRFAVSGSISIPDTWFESDLVTFVHLVQPGTLSLRYKKTTKIYNKMRNGTLIVYVNGEKRYQDDSPLDSRWTVITLDLSAGPNQIIVSFEMYSAQGQEMVTAVVDYIEVLGTDYNAKECFPCPSGYSNAGASSCDICPINTYLSTTNGVNSCADCPSGKYAPAGSVGVEACLSMSACTAHDYTATYSHCINNQTNKTYSWIEPEICNQAAITLPAHEHNLPCEACSPGMRYGSKGEEGEMECQWCPSGQALKEGRIGEECEICAAGEYARKVLNYSGFTEMPKQMTTFCQLSSESCKLSEGWVPIETALSTVSPT